MPLSSLAIRFLNAWRERVLVLQAMSFATVGVVNTSIDFAVFCIAVLYLGAPIVPELPRLMLN